MPGDDIRRIDWSLFGRTDRHYIKLFEAETNANFAVLLDVSRSMSYGSHEVTQARLRPLPRRGCLLFFSNRQRDRVGLVTFDHEHRRVRAAVHEAHGHGAARAGPRGGGASRAP